MAVLDTKAGGTRNSKATAAAITALTAKFGNRLVTSRAVRQQHANTTTWIANEPPDAVVFPQSTGDVQELVCMCAAHRVPVIAFGAGTSLEGHVNAPFGGICIDFRDMNSVLTVNSSDLDCIVQPGITRKQLNEHLRDQGLFFPIDPGADASLGGMAATRCSGTNAVRYGTMKDNVLALKAVLANGELITTGKRARKSAAGYDLTRLMIGSEGTLGVITELTLKLSGIPEAISAGVCQFPSVEAACDAAIVSIQSGIPIARIELLDELQVKATNLRALARLRAMWAAVPLNGRQSRRTALVSGKPGTTLTGPPGRCGPGCRPSPPMYAFPSRACRNVSRRRNAILPSIGWLRPFSAMLAMAISTCRCWSIWQMPMR
jgi:D-lactate dehydrogenase (cytochrome)